MQKSSLITLVVIFGVLLLVGFVTYTIYVTDGDKKDSEAATLFGEQSETTFTDLEGNAVTLTDYAGKIRVVTTWASWCPFCVEELQNFETVAKEFKDQDIVFIAINRMEQKERAQNFLKKVGTLENILFVLDPTDSFYTSVGGFSMPETIFYNTEGKQVVHQRGQLTPEQMREHIQNIIAVE